MFAEYSRHAVGAWLRLRGAAEAALVRSRAVLLRNILGAPLPPFLSPAFTPCLVHRANVLWLVVEARERGRECRERAREQRERKKEQEEQRQMTCAARLLASACTRAADLPCAVSAAAEEAAELCDEVCSACERVARAERKEERVAGDEEKEEDKEEEDESSKESSAESLSLSLSLSSDAPILTYSHLLHLLHTARAQRAALAAEKARLVMMSRVKDLSQMAPFLSASSLTVTGNRITNSHDGDTAPVVFKRLMRSVWRGEGLRREESKKEMKERNRDE